MTCRTSQRGTGIAQISDEYLYEALGLYDVAVRLNDLSRGEALMGWEEPDAIVPHVRFDERRHTTCTMRGHPASGTVSFRACDSRGFSNSTVTCIKIPPIITVLRCAATMLQYKYLKSELRATKKYGIK